MDKWSNEERTIFKKFWESEVGKKYLKRLKQTKKQLLQASMGSQHPEEAFYYSMIANGFESVEEDIKLLQEQEKKEDAAKKE